MNILSSEYQFFFQGKKLPVPFPLFSAIGRLCLPSHCRACPRKATAKGGEHEQIPIF